MRNELRWLVVTIVAAVFLVVSDGKAELPPSAYRKYQKDAPEYVKIKVESVKTRETEKGDVKIIRVVVEAKVLQVERSKSGLEKGDSIRIEYTNTIRKRPFVGPSQVPIVKKGKEYPAFLEKEGKTYTPAAGGFTFHVVK